MARLATMGWPHLLVRVPQASLVLFANSTPPAVPVWLAKTEPHVSSLRERTPAFVPVAGLVSNVNPTSTNVLRTLVVTERSVTMLPTGFLVLVLLVILVLFVRPTLTNALPTLVATVDLVLMLSTASRAAGTHFRLHNLASLLPFAACPWRSF
jgi:hypothetical protein